MIPDLRKIIHPCLLRMVPSRISVPVEVIEPAPELQGARIYAINHSCVMDVPVSCDVIKEHVYILAGKQKLPLTDRLFFILNGVIWVDRKDRLDKKRSFQKMKRKVQQGKNILIYPEGTWNLTPSKPLLPLNWGIIQLAKETGVPIVPLVLEYYPKRCYAKYGSPIYINPEMDKQAGIELLEETMATIRWSIWEMFSTQHRVEEMKDEFDSLIRQRLETYPCLDYEYEMSVVRER